MNGATRKISFDISYSTFFKVLLLVVIGLLLYLVRDVLLMMFLGIVIASALDPVVDFFQKKKVPRGVSVVIVYIILIGLLFGFFGLVVPSLVTQIQQLGTVLPGYLNDLGVFFEGTSGLTVAQGLEQASKYISSFTEKLDEAIVSVYEALSAIFGGVVSGIVVFVISFYFLIQEGAFKKMIQSVVPGKHRAYARDLTDRIQTQMGRWLRGQLLLGLTVGILTYIVLSLLGVKYALILAIIAGILEIVPYIGPVIAAIPAILLALTQSPIMALIVLIAYIVIQQVENHLLVPNVMKRAVGLNPLIVILVILAGVKIAGIAGAIVAVPVATAIGVFLGDVFEERKEREKAIEQETKKKQKEKQKEEKK
ncbi:AI-2E family transporter [Patescibacteria group bacterium]|nr:AI-2E family transporter [Patescibacteria group bacterium]